MTQLSQKTISVRAWAELLLLGIVWGGVFLAVRIALNEIGVLTAVAHRTFWAALVLWMAVASLKLSIPRSPRVWGAFLVMGLLNNIIPFTLLNWSQLYIESGLTSIFNAATAIFGVVVAAIFFADERLSARKTLGVVIGFLGVVTVIGFQNLTAINITSVAQFAALGATLSYAFAGVWARKQLAGLTPQVAAAGMVTCSALIALPAAWIVDGPFRFGLQPQTWAALAYFSVIATAGAYLLYYRVLAMAGSGNLMLVTLLIPPFAIGLGALILGETLSANAFTGFGLLALGLLVLDGRLFGWLKTRTSKKPQE
ncbi:EamA domain-containing membrane protein RarD [Shimia gijangensis]|uniref:EamA domain-containing membrane protein RarD n=1 Tax=Shimia gijangensis TaxID=1470563 RepID=A0A1M6HRZ7_9RHOB|nr:DMT family transporter [Shimia gijangensis]SHJ24938.1 EamA domain-containing membrane protein RarD [Shimia gijangensis]